MGKARWGWEALEAYPEIGVVFDFVAPMAKRLEVLGGWRPPMDLLVARKSAKKNQLITVLLMLL